jgi:CRP/FNR family transcriptional regulator, cyclic AMP receptor protein
VSQDESQAKPTVMELLRGCAFLEPLSDEHVEAVAGIAQLIEIPGGQRVFREGDVADDVYIVVSGRIALEICAPAVGCKRVCTLESGELLGWSPVLGEGRFTATARTVEPTRLVRLEARALRDLCHSDLELGYEFMHRTSLALAKRLSAARLQLIDVYGSQMPEAAENLLPTSTQGGTAAS